MAKRRRRTRRNPNFIGIKVTAGLTIGALVAGQIVKVNLLDLSQEFLAISADLVWTLEGITAQEGPLLFGLAHSDYDVAEILEAVDASPNNDSDLIQLEHSRRMVRVVGAFPIVGTAGGGQFNDGNKKRTKMNWRVSNNKEVALWARNDDNSTLATGGQITASGTVWGVWR